MWWVTPVVIAHGQVALESKKTVKTGPSRLGVYTEPLGGDKRKMGQAAISNPLK
jgi:hypothetical protein